MGGTRGLVGWHLGGPRQADDHSYANGNNHFV